MKYNKEVDRKCRHPPYVASLVYLPGPPHSSCGCRPADERALVTVLSLSSFPNLGLCMYTTQAYVQYMLPFVCLSRDEKNLCPSRDYVNALSPLAASSMTD